MNTWKHKAGIIALIAIAGTMGLALAGCGGSDDDPTTPYQPLTYEKPAALPADISWDSLASIDPARWGDSNRESVLFRQSAKTFTFKLGTTTIGVFTADSLPEIPAWGEVTGTDREINGYKTETSVTLTGAWDTDWDSWVITYPGSRPYGDIDYSAPPASPITIRFERTWWTEEQRWGANSLREAGTLTVKFEGARDGYGSGLDGYVEGD
jgi:hypothetical protein